VSGDSSLSTALSSETSSRESSDVSLSTSLSTETSSRISGDVSLTNALSLTDEILTPYLTDPNTVTGSSTFITSSSSPGSYDISLNKNCGRIQINLTTGVNENFFNLYNDKITTSSVILFTMNLDDTASPVGTIIANAYSIQNGVVSVILENRSGGFPSSNSTVYLNFLILS
jgi:hypothetical protein